MKCFSFCFIYGFILLFTYSILAQENIEQTKQKIELTQLNIEQKLDRTVMNLSALMISGIAYAKSLGQTPEEFGQFIGEIFATGWKETKGKGIAPFVENMYKNFQADKNCQWEIINESETVVQIKMKRFADSTVKAYSKTGVTADEYDRCMGKLIQAITNYLGFYYNQGSQDDWIIFWISTEKEIFQK